MLFLFDTFRPTVMFINIRFGSCILWGASTDTSVDTRSRPPIRYMIRIMSTINSMIRPLQYLGHVRLGSIRNKNNWNNASKRLFGSYSHSGIPGFHSGYSAPRSRIAGILFRNTFLFQNIPKRTRPKLSRIVILKRR